MISKVSGTFKNFNGEVESEAEDFNQAKITLEIDAASIDTNQAKRDGHLKSPLFSDAKKYPAIKFKGLLDKKETRCELKGDLVLCGVTKPVSLEVDHTGIGQGRFGNTRAGFEIGGKIR